MNTVDAATPRRILIVDDDANLRKTLSAILAAKGYAPISAATVEAALDSVGEGSLAAALIDLRLEDASGLDLMVEIKRRSSDTECIVLTGHASQDSAIEAINLGAYSYFQKPYDVDQLLVIVRRAVEKREAAEALRASEEKYRLVSENIPVVVYSALPDERSTSILISGRMSGLTGYSPKQFLENPDLWSAIIHPEDRTFVWETIQEHRRNKSQLDVEYRIVTKDNEIKWIRDKATPTLDEDGQIVRIDGFMEDITRRRWAEEALRESEERLQQQERLAAIGQLAGGIAHDFNNLLTSIILDADILLHRPHLPTDVASGLQSILGESRRAAELVQQILDFSRRSMMHARPIELATCVEDALHVLQRTLPETIHLRVETEGARLTVNADPGRIQQALINLAANARDAMPGGGDLRIGLSRMKLEPGDDPPVAEMPPGEWVCLSVSDTGAGISPDVMSHLFEPFFTTKSVGEGTGLGLAQVYGIVKQHKGYIGVETEEGQGTTFSIYLPACQDRGTGDTVREGTADPVPRGRGETILLVEDEASVREAGQGVVESLGYRVLTAANGREALEICRSVEDIDLVITDLVMPEVGGRELFRELRKRFHDLKALAITGYVAEQDVRELQEAGFLDVVCKPFDLQTLAEVIRRALDAD